MSLTLKTNLTTVGGITFTISDGANVATCVIPDDVVYDPTIGERQKAAVVLAYVQLALVACKQSAGSVTPGTVVVQPVQAKLQVHQDHGLQNVGV